MMERLATQLATTATTTIMNQEDTSNSALGSFKSLTRQNNESGGATFDGNSTEKKSVKKHYHFLPSPSGKPQLTTIGNNLASLQYIIQQKEAEINNLKQIVMAHMKLIDSLRENEHERTKEIKQKSQTIDALLSKIDDLTKQQQCSCNSNNCSSNPESNQQQQARISVQASVDQSKMEKEEDGASITYTSSSHINYGKRIIEAASSTPIDQCIGSKKVKKSQSKESDVHKITNDDVSVLSRVKIKPKITNKRMRPSSHEKIVAKNPSTNLTDEEYYSAQNSKNMPAQSSNLNGVTNIINIYDQKDDCENDDLCFFTTQDDYEIFSVMNNYEMDGPRENNTILPVNDSRANSPEPVDQIEVPSWRINHLIPSTDDELLENLDDDTYNRRHMKHEIEERRRKRWDLQRLRDQQLKMKHGNTQLYTRRDKSLQNDDLVESDDESKFKSFFPSVTDVRFIEINNEIPVVAFGRPVPKISNKWFSFPGSESGSDARPSKPLIAR